MPKAATNNSISDMNLTVLIVIAVVILGLGGAAAIEGKLLLNAHEQMGDLKASNAAQAAVITQNQKDADLGIKLANVEKMLNDRFAEAVQPAKETIIRVPANQICPGDAAGAAAAAGVVQLRAAYREARQAQPAGQPDGAVRPAAGKPAGKP